MLTQHTRQLTGDVLCRTVMPGASNYPLRGGKGSFFKGGIRANAFVSGGFLAPAVRGTKQVVLLCCRC